MELLGNAQGNAFHRSLIFHLLTGVNGTNSERPPPTQPSLRSRSVQDFGLVTQVASVMSAGDSVALPTLARKYLANRRITRHVEGAAF